ncbi:MAG: hydantoinase B/oxoprolinase family protein [Chloroflexota bacterium]|nr:hydantoinase B/oxoprolinase family protein [Chloroflexota bacterium]
MSALTCLQCGTLSPAVKKFCEECGAPLPRTCPNCGTTVGATARFCGECAAPLRPDGTEAAFTLAAPLAEERRLVTVLFCDLVGFTPLAEQLDVEEVRDIQADYFSGMSQQIERYGGLHGFEPDGTFFLLREVLGGSGGRSYADGSDVIHIVPDSKNLPAEFAETRFPILIEQLALATDSGGPGMRRGGLGYRKDIRLLQDAAFISTADRSILSCYGLKGGKAGLPYRALVNPETPDERLLPGLVDNFELKAGDLLRLETTGGGGWGDPLEREPELVLRDVIKGKVSPGSAYRDYGVVLVGEGDGLKVDRATTEQLRAAMAAAHGPLQLIHRGPGYERLARR